MTHESDSIVIVSDRGDVISKLKGFAFEIVYNDGETTEFERALMEANILDFEEGLRDIRLVNQTVYESDIIRTPFDNIIVFDINHDENANYGDILFVLR